MAINSYRDILVWQQAMELVTAIYQSTETWPKEEAYGLTSQVRRAAVSIPANIAEGYGRDTRGSYQQFLRIAQGSLKEMETHLLIAERLGFIRSEKMEPIMTKSESVGKLLRLLIRKLSET
ncbi:MULTISPECIES: four helix bundle protein [Brucella/Ochrobactrum group]|uniref:Four helix bundle protein n=1 Tax=Brucella pseudintermedia TaxID=370111 RepID=A0ABY5UI64_9HYPH|nr:MULTISPECIES: four helix bundle protein [Brucella/Ochrobactrum group]MCO7728325.1 four helix bundle protein [Brucella intermedia]NKE74601.1 four helix bundle protein [Ochrobactrum sp. MC-1LL]KAB2684849.1 four helix bundle protein [Brucella pseudintermedia]UWL63071.1 four helix bundle protein [Brucella pseudintermedia]WPM82903.1 four helix bundle protein [Brucella pseudintermedia]